MAENTSEQQVTATKTDNIVHVNNLHTHFKTLDGIVRAVNGVTLEIKKG